MFIPLPSSEVCDHGSQTSISMAQMLARTWQNFDPSLRIHIPDSIIFHPDGTGTISTSFEVFSCKGPKTETFTHGFTWKLARNGPLGMEDMDFGTLFNTFPKLVRSTTAWTYKTWVEGLVAVYTRIELVGNPSYANIPFQPLDDLLPQREESNNVLPIELLDHIFALASESYSTAIKLSVTCRRVREICLREHRRHLFSSTAERFAANGMAIWIQCGHFNPMSSNPPAEFYALHAHLFKYPDACRYPIPQAKGWEKGWEPRRSYFSCKLPMPQGENIPVWQKALGQSAYDAHPEVEKAWT